MLVARSLEMSQERERNFHHQSPSNAQGRKSLWTKIRDDTIESNIKGLFKDLAALDYRLIIRTKSTGFWLTVRGTTVTVTVLAAT